MRSEPLYKFQVLLEFYFLITLKNSFISLLPVIWIGLHFQQHSIINSTLMFPCIVNVIQIDNQQDATVLIYLLLISSTCFGRSFRPSSGAYHCNYSFWYCPLMLLLAGVEYCVEMT